MSVTSIRQQGVRDAELSQQQPDNAVPQRQTMDELSSVAQARLERLVSDVTKSLVAGIRAVLIEEGRRNADMASDDPTTRLRAYMASVEPVTIESLSPYQREANTPRWDRSIR